MISTAAVMRDTSVGMATPSVLCGIHRSGWHFRNIHHIHDHSHLHGDFRVPIARNMAAPALYSAINGMEAVTIIRYVSACPMTSASIWPNTTCRTNHFPQYMTAMITTARIVVNQISCVAAREASFPFSARDTVRL